MARKRAKRRLRGEVFQIQGRRGWYIRLRIGEKRKTRKGGDTRSEAEDVLTRVLARLYKGGPWKCPEIALEKFVEEHLRYCEVEHTPSTYRVEASRLLGFAAYFDGRRLSQIGRADVEEFLLSLAEAGRKIATRNRHLAQIRRMFERAVDLGYLEDNACARMKQLKEEVRPVPVLSPEDQQALVGACPDRVRDLVHLAISTGCRQSELLHLEWRDLDLDQGTLTIRRSKNKTPRMVPLTQALRDRLVALKAGRTIPMDGPDRVLPHLSLKWCGHSVRLFKRACAAIGHPGLRFHDLRHQAALNLTRAGVPLADVQQWLGHRSLRMTLRYSGHSPENSGEMAVAKLEEFLSEAARSATQTG